MAARNDEGLYAKARSLFISRATMDDFTGWATPRQTEACPLPGARGVSGSGGAASGLLPDL